ncbi:hypothetical protein E1287_35500 [Actinomadura sp. KC06]|uniref:hypothetical protein n=1 Tax=Actinomadura sp. KC06 TaxID=2530369 RepID=UPI001047C247|nr:hypothetical protein [Actinomadura sp. KC06]TDD27026.1 hypothetical protein E1287_35500 [Actinomadura sp. KC06]
MRSDGFDVLTDLNSALDSRGLLTGLTVGVVTFVCGLVYGRFRKRRLISWAVLYDEPINRTFQDDGPDMWEISSQGQEIDKGSLVVLDIASAGRDDIVEGDFALPLSFQFPGRESSISRSAIRSTCGERPSTPPMRTCNPRTTGRRSYCRSSR